MSHKIAVEVVYALPEKQYLQRVTLEEGATVEAAIRASGILELRRDIDLAKNKVGIYSRPVKLGDVLKEGDRVEIYRPLIADPKELRRQRAEKSGKKPNKHTQKRCSLSTFLRCWRLIIWSGQACCRCWSAHRHC